MVLLGIRSSRTADLAYSRSSYNYVTHVDLQSNQTYRFETSPTNPLLHSPTQPIKIYIYPPVWHQPRCTETVSINRLTTAFVMQFGNSKEYTSQLPRGATADKNQDPQFFSRALQLFSRMIGLVPFQLAALEESNADLYDSADE
ncbi:hypothetical protein RRG08_051293 [Elysia crispata]|uniref:Uncharacterized protein n=1 Tax=Elysia crispata TaxID=231223 RepID=A0AAE0XSG2_9GAST|nr:hypothetical protein RRG08_051293 [Elysia crispata]